MILDKLFELMAEKSASDLFLSSGTAINIKIQGVVMPINQQVMEPAMIQHMLYEMLSPEQIEHFETEKELNLSVGRRDLGNFRVNMFWQRHSIGAVIRYITSDIPTTEELGLPTTLNEVVMEKRGLVLIVGATGSGKSTTLAAMLDHRNRNRSGHILTVEDPIEYLFRHRKSVINQREVGIDTHTWHDALRNAMRQAPDCILIGEIRDRETMQHALAYAQTGHLCLATLHANNAYHAMNRIVNFFPLENRSLLYLDLAVALKCVVSQRLVRKPDGKRAPTVEILMNTRHISELIERGELSEIKEAMEKSIAPGSQTFEQDLFKLYKSGVITLDEALGNSDSPTNLSWLINNSEFGDDSSKGKASKPMEEEEKQKDRSQAEASFQEFTLHVEDD